VELALAQARAGAPEAGESLREAAIARAPQGLLAMARELLLQRRSSRPPAGSTPPLPEPSADPAEALRAAARLARGPEDDVPRDLQAVAQERAAVGSIARTEPEYALAELIAFDTAASSRTYRRCMAPSRELGARGPRTIRPALALLSLLPAGSEQARELEPSCMPPCAASH
jgi:hypothetical protein